ncbi:MAG: signal recognition particle-docking protein FtsY [Gemmatimonadales bacterium]|nr:signal recognition particle-docking protein FtsY [Gemmatimonadales bacterium]
MSRLGTPTRGIWQRIKRLALTDVGALARGLNAQDLEEMERLLIEADFGVPATLDLTEYLEGEVRKGKLRTDEQLRGALVDRLAVMLGGDRDPAALNRPAEGPTVVLVVGVNGVGKTTSIAKLARHLQRNGQSVLLAAADTYRAGAVAQLETWAERLGVECVSGRSGGDPAAVAFDAVEAAISRGVDVVLIDTAGRLHTQEGLMGELGKVVRVIKRKLPDAPHEVFLVLDGTVGQNAVQQGKLFAQVVPPTGLIVTKLDGSARGGALVALRRELDTPVRFIGLGESLDDLEPFDAASWAAGLVGN